MDSLKSSVSYGPQILPTACKMPSPNRKSLANCSLRQHNEDEARDTFKTLKNQHIADSNALLFHEWASLEAKSGNVTKALDILGKAIKDNAQPDRCVR